jgi:predicted phage terminase large subunit-like protein
MESQFLGFDEMTQIKEDSYTFLLTRLRKPDPSTGNPLAFVPLRARGASNPAPNWVRRRFLEEGKSHGRLYIPALLDENPYVDKPSYREALSKVGSVLRAQMEFGDWYAEETGLMFNRDDFRIVAPNELPEFEPRSIVRFWDLAASEVSANNPDPDWTVGAKVAIRDGYMFILDMVRFRGSSDRVERKVLETAYQDGADVKIRMDQDPGQAGKALISHYGRNILLGYDFAGVPIPKDKVSRVNLWAPKAKRGEILLVRGEWAGDFVDEALAFGPNSPTHDDQMDAVSGAFETLTGIHLKKRGTVRLLL